MSSVLKEHLSRFVVRVARDVVVKEASEDLGVVDDQKEEENQRGNDLCSHEHVGVVVAWAQDHN